MVKETKAIPSKGPSVRVAGKGKTQVLPFVTGKTVSQWATEAGKAPVGSEKFFIGQEERPADFVVTEPATITIGTEASNGV